MEFDFGPYDRMIAGLRIRPQKQAENEREALATAERAAVWPFPVALSGHAPSAPCMCRACNERRIVERLAS